MISNETKFNLDWDLKNLDDIGVFGRGKSKNRPRDDKSLFGGDYPFVQTGDIKSANLNLRNYSNTYNKKGLDQSKLWQKGTLCITIAANIAETAILKIDACFPDSIVGFVPKEDKLDAYFMHYVFSYIKRMIQRSVSGSVQDNINLGYLKKLKFRIPNLPERKSITKILKDLDDKIEINNRINKNLEDMVQAIFKSWFVDFEPFQDCEFEDSELGRIPKGWRVVELGGICKCVLGGTPSRKIEGYWNGNIPWINSGKVNEYRIIEASEYISELGLRKSATTLLPSKTVVLAITGATLGQVSLLEVSSCANQSVIGILENADIPYEFIYQMICYHIQEIINQQTGGAQQHINKGNVENEKLIIPSLKIMTDYKSTVKSLYDSIANNCFENKTLKEIRESLLPKLMSGEIRVQIEGMEMNG